MVHGFRAKLDAAVAAAHPDSIGRTRHSIEALLAAGATSVEGLVPLVLDHRLPAEARAEACWLLDRFGCRQAAPVLLQALKSPDREVRSAAARALSGLRIRRAAPAVLALFHDTDPGVRWDAAVALSAMGSKRSVRPLISILRGDGDADARAAAAYALGFIGDERAGRPLIDVLADAAEPVEVRTHAAEALGHLADHCEPEWLPDALAVLRRTLADPAPEVRFWVLFAVAGLGDASDLPVLEHLAARDHAVGWEHYGRTVAVEAEWAARCIRERLGMDTPPSDELFPGEPAEAGA